MTYKQSDDVILCSLWSSGGIQLTEPLVDIPFLPVFSASHHSAAFLHAISLTLF